MSKFTKLLVFSFCLLITNAYAQMPGGGMSPPEFDAEKAAGLINYPIKKVIKKLKITDAMDKVKAEEALNVYNNKMYALSVEHGPALEQLERTFDSQIEIAMQKRDPSVMKNVRAEIQTTIMPIRKEVNNQELLLNETMASILDESQNKKWLDYQARMKQQ